MKFSTRFAWTLVAFGAVSSSLMTGCGKRDTEPHANVVVEGLESQELASYEQFKTTVVPILESRCALNCHDVPVADYDEFIHRSENAGFFYFPVDPLTGRIPPDDATMTQAFHVTRGPVGEADGHGGLAHSRVAYGEATAFSPLLRVPLAGDQGGTPHRGMDVFNSSADEDYEVIGDWVDTELALRPVAHAELPHEQAVFRDEILPLLVRNGCFVASCHGPLVFNDMKLAMPMPSPDGKFDPKRDMSRAIVAKNHKIMLGVKSRFANLGGDLKLSRLIVKNLPLELGGVHQRGGNIQFFDSYDDPDVQIILKWLTLEKKALAAKLKSRDKPILIEDIGRLQGVAFIRGPKHQPRRFFEFDQFWPGSDIIIAPNARGGTTTGVKREPFNLTASFHPDGPVEIQSFDVRYDGRAIVFSMRDSAERGFRLYEVQLDNNLKYIADSLREISHFADRLDDGTLIHAIDPIYSPGPNDTKGTVLDDVRVSFASNAAGTYAPSDMFGILGEADGGDNGTIIDSQRPEAAGTFDGRRLYIVDGPDKGEWRKIVKHTHDEESVVGAKLQLDKPLAHTPDRRTVFMIEQTQASNLSSFDVWRCVPSKHKDPKQAFTETLRRVTFRAAQDRRLSMRSTGEVMMTSVRNMGFQGDRPVFNGAIFRMMAGGFDYHIQGGNRARYPIYCDSRELPQGLEVRMGTDPRNLSGGGMLMLADHGFGIHIEPENPADNDVLGKPLKPASRRYLPATAPFFPETGKQAITHTGRSPGGSYRDPFPLPDGTILVSRAVAEVNHLDPDADPDWDIYRISFTGPMQNTRGNAVANTELTKFNAGATPDSAEYWPRPIIVRLKEKPTTHQKFAPRTDGKKPTLVDGVLRMPEGLPGEIECYDYPLLQSFLVNFAPTGARDFRVGLEGPTPRESDPDHMLRYVRVIAQVLPTREEIQPISGDGAEADPFATAISKGVHTRKLIVSEIPLEPDGTFYAQVPTEVPLIVQGLNHNKMAMHSMNRWFYLQPGEKLTFSIPRKIYPHLCSGCHGSLTGNSYETLGPPDVVSAASRVMATWDPVAKRRRAAYSSGESSADHISVDFRNDVQPILDAKCISCHDGSGPEAAGMDLRGTPTKHYTVAYETLHRLSHPESGNHADKRFINEREGSSLESSLMEKILGRELDAPQTLDTPGVPHPAPEGLTEQELLTLTRWIDLGATFLGGHSKDKQPGAPLARRETAQ